MGRGRGVARGRREGEARENEEAGGREMMVRVHVGKTKCSTSASIAINYTSSLLRKTGSGARNTKNGFTRLAKMSLTCVTCVMVRLRPSCTRHQLASFCTSFWIQHRTAGLHL